MKTGSTWRFTPPSRSWGSHRSRKNDAHRSRRPGGDRHQQIVVGVGDDGVAVEVSGHGQTPSPQDSRRSEPARRGPGPGPAGSAAAERAGGGCAVIRR